MKQISLLFSIIALVGVGILLFGSEEAKPDRAHTATHSGNMADHDDEEHLEVAIVMGRIQRFHQKFWLAARAGNKELVEFYLHEMEEAMEEVADAGVIEEGIDVSEQMRIYGLSAIEELEKKMKSDGVEAVLSDGELLVNSCNSCHRTSGYPQIKIQVPQGDAFPDQDFAP